jgi:hypothetical protein
MSKAEWDDSRDVLAMLFGPNWTHKRIDAELSKADEIIEKRRNAALGRHAKSKEDASAVHVQSTSTDTGVPPRTLNQVAKEEPKGSSKKRATRLSADWLLPKAWGDEAVAEGLSPDDVRSQAENMRDWSLSAPNGAKLDWHAAWRLWFRKAIKDRPRQRGSPPPRASSSSALADSAERLVQSMRSADEIRSGSSGRSIPALIPHLPVR